MISEFLTRGTTPSISTEQTGVTQQFLRLHLIPDTTALLAVNQISEVLTIPMTQVVPIPHMPAWVLGVYNWRGDILWIIDLGHLLGLTPLSQHTTNSSTYTAVVIRDAQQHRATLGQNTSDKVLGLLVNRVEDLELCNPDVIQSPPESAVKSELVPYLRGYWLKRTGEIFVVLDSNSIIAGMTQNFNF
ncbi:chemotaxis protein CheW [Gloeocapsopsis sp. IPPAS B-1203]|uniref:chemotaxis protein CheW n=1 Tax=Gloeocapsopsis sp. IPPAS B-1203 TaxID=2049454 RepID=UPI000C18B3EC|nr:chemotaxis protein CheW [Gloeocapsopsis sp. IPPAS B-1203]PIG95327.1 chemotaxis protein CheW [Gloeocapsopsis sp. IPPAS B-1203]